MTRQSILAGVGLLFAASQVLSQQATPLNPSDLLSNDQFGNAVAVEYPYAVVCANQSSDNGSHPGKAYVFNRTTNAWEQQAILAAGSGFGADAAIAGTSVVIGAFEEAYVFEPDGTNWVQQARLTPSVQEGLAFFGHSVAMTSDRIVIGAHGEEAIYIFDRPPGGWVDATETERISVSASGSFVSGSFGSDVAICGDRLLIGARGDGAAGSYSGVAYVFELAGSNWVQTAKLVGSTLEPYCFSGESVALSEHFAFVDGYCGNQPSQVYVFKYSDTNWTEVAILEPNDQSYSGFSLSISIDKPFALIGDPRNSASGSYSGAAHLYVLSTGEIWQSWGLLPSAGLSSNDFFGYSAGIHSNSAFVGAFRADAEETDSGRCYAYDLRAPRLDSCVTSASFGGGRADIIFTNLTYGSTVSIDIAYELTSNSWTEVWRGTAINPGPLVFETNTLPTGAAFYRMRADESSPDSRYPVKTNR